MNEQRTPQIIPLKHGVVAWLPVDPTDERAPEIFHTKHGAMVWLPSAQDEQPPKIESIVTHIGTIFWAHSSQEIEEALAPARKEIQDIEAKRPYSDLRSFFNCCIPLLLVYCLQDAVRQVLREAVAVVKAKGSMDWRAPRVKYLESVAEQARLDSLNRLAMTNLYSPLKRGERVTYKDTLEDTMADIIERFLGTRAAFKRAIREILQEGNDPRPRAIARKLDLGVENKKRDHDTGIKKVERTLKDFYPRLTASQAINELVKEIKAEDSPSVEEKQIGKKNSRRKAK